MRNIHRAADRVSGIVVAVKRARQSANVIYEGIGVEIVMTMIDVAAAVKLARAALCYQCNLAARVASILRLILARQYLEFRHGIDADGHVLTVIGPRIDIANTVYSQLITRAPVTVDKHIS